MPSYTYEDVTYSRADETLYVNVKYDDAIKYDYVMYQNEGYSEKWFFAFIESYNYENNEVTSLKIKTDVFQTWMFDYDIYPSFVEREHVSDDTLGLHTYPEGIEYGEYVTIGDEIFSTFNSYEIVLGSSVNPWDLNNINGIYQGIPSAVGYMRYPITQAGIDNLRDGIQELIDRTKQDAITSVFIAPSILTTYDSQNPNVINNSWTPTIIIENLHKITSIDSYVPKNNKLLCYPYCYASITNGASNEMILQQELWNDIDNPQLKITMALCPGCSIIAQPIDYAGNVNYPEHTLVMGKLPQLNWGGDLYINWQTQQGVNNTIQQISGWANIVLGAGATTSSIMNDKSRGSDVRGSIGQMVGGIADVVQATNQQRLAELMPPITKGNINSGDAMFSSNQLRIGCLYKSIRREYAILLDSFLTKYGYKINEIKMPNLTSRTNWNYIKTIGIVINPKTNHGILNHDLDEIKEIYNRGITLWHNPSTMFDYSQSNNIVT